MKESGEEYVGGFGEKKGKGENLQLYYNNKIKKNVEKVLFIICPFLCQALC